MAKRKILLAVCAFVLICALSVTGTLAYLHAKTDPVTNTFVAAGGGKLCDSIELKEHSVSADEAGLYTLGGDEVAGNSYTVLPGVNVPKDPFIRVNGKTDAAAFVYVEIINTNPQTLIFEVDDTWTLLPDVAGPMGGDVYVYGDCVQTTTGTQTYNIIKDKTVTLADGELSFTQGSNDSLKFYGYIAQGSVTVDGSSVSDSSLVFTTCFAAA